LEKEETLDLSCAERRKPAKRGNRGLNYRKRPRGRKRLDMLSEVLKEASYTELKRKEESKKERRTLKPRTCLTAEH